MKYDNYIRYIVYKSLIDNPILPNGIIDISSRESFINSYKGFGMKTFREFLNEVPQYIQDDCIFGKEDLERLMGNDKSLYRYSWGIVRKLKAIDNKGDKESKKCLIFADKARYILGVCYDGMLEVYSEITHKERKSYPEIGSVLEITGVNTHSDKRFNRFASAIYKSIIAEAKVMSDSIQYDGDVNIWKSFINSHEDWKFMIDDKKIKVVLYCMNTKKIVHKDLTNISDDKIWGNEEMGSYRLVAYI